MQSTNLNIRPYFDDFDEAKGFQKILFRPSPIKVQTRELNQIQSIFSNQIEKFANHIFKDGSVVIPGGLTITNSQVSMKFTLAGGSEFTDLEGIKELYVQAKDNGVNGRILSLERYLAEPDTMFAIIELIDSGTGDAVTFQPEDDLYFNTYDANDVMIRVGYGVAQTLGGAIVARMTKGVYYVRGMFIDVDDQMLVVDKNFNDTSHKVGFNVEEKIITESDDNTLYSNAQGTPNSKAPGAHRLRVDLTLMRGGFSEEIENFVELAKIKDGKIQTMVTQSTYNLLEDAMAQRTYEQAGDYNVSAHQIDLREHLKVDNNGGVYTADEGGDASKMVAVMKPGISYVRGYRVQNLGEINVVIDKARDTAKLNNSPVAVSTGNFLLSKASKGVPVISRSTRYRLLNSTGTQIGSALLISAERSGTEFRLFLRDIIWTGDRTTFAKISFQDGGVTRFISDLESKEFSQSSSLDLIFDLPVFGVKSLIVGDSIDINYTVMRSYKIALDSTGSGSVAAPAGYSFSPEFALYAGAKSDGSAAQINISNSLSLTGTPVGSALNVNLSAGSANQEIMLMAMMVRTTAVVKTKTVASIIDTVTFTNQNTKGLSQTDGIAIKQVRDDKGNDVTGNFTFDGGQRDAGYYLASVASTIGNINGVFTVEYEYFTHSAGDFFTADSYTSIPYEKIPNYISQSSGTVYGLADSIDFRGRITNGTSDTDMVRPNSAIIMDVEYYLPRVDAVYVSAEGNFGAARGISSDKLASPSIPDNAMRLYELMIPPYTPNIDGVNINTIDNRRYTMRDIGKLEKRIENVEYYTTLSQLESSASTQQVFDPITGNPRYKNGIAADPFKDYRLIDDLSVDWSGSIDTDTGRLRPFVQQNVIDMAVDKTWSSIKDGMVCCQSVLDVSVAQDYATTTINVNPYAVFNWNGYIKLTPTTDYWFENYYVEPRIINETINTRGTVQPGTVYGTWRTVSVSERVWEPHGAGGVWWGYRYRTTVSTRDVTTYTYTDQTTTNFAGEQIVETQVIPYMRETQVRFSAAGLRPFTNMFAFFSGRNVNAYVQQDGKAKGAQMVSDANGNINGTFFVPRNDALKFNTGDNVFRLSDNANDSRDEDETRTSAEAVHKSFGKKQGIQKTFVNTRILGYTAQTGQETSSSEVVVDTWRDPIAQSFMVASTRGGEYIEAIDVYFSTKSRDVPITMEIREMENGLPASTVITRKTLNPTQVSVSTNSSVATRFTFDYPVYLNANTEFAVVLLANTQDYNAYIAEMGKKNLLTNEYIAKQPYTGVFFTSSNGSTWSPNQMADLKFRLYRGKYSQAPNVVTFNPKAGPQYRPLGLNTAKATLGSTNLVITAPGHGLTTNNTVVLKGMTGGSGITPEMLNKSHVVVDATYSSFTITVSAAADSDGTIGGAEASFLGNYLVNMFYASVSKSVVDGCSLMLEYRYRDAASNSFSDWIEFESDTDVPLPTEGIYRTTADFQVRATMTPGTSNPYIAPQIDGDDFSIILNSYGVDPFEDVFSYVTKDLGFDNPCTTAKLFYGAMLPSQSSMVVQAKVIRAGQTANDVAWQNLTPLSPLVNDGSNFFEYEYDLTVSSNNPFVGLKIRTLIRGSRVAPPSLKDFRLIALA